MLPKILLSLFLLSSCVSLNESIDPNVVYRHDIVIDDGYKRSVGTAVLANSPSYSLVFESEGLIDTFTLKTCHRYKVINDETIVKRKSIKVLFKPTKIESEKLACPLIVHAYEKNKGRHSFGYIDFNRAFFTLPAGVSCNGTDQSFNGVSVCQSEQGLIQRIAFNKVVTVDVQSKCADVKTKDYKNFEITLSKGFCSYVFVSTDGEWHRLTTIGFEKVLVY